MPKQWFVLQAGTNRENRVKKQLWNRIQKDALQEQISSLLVATERVTKIKDGKRYTVEHKLYPGYIMAEINVPEDGKIPPAVLNLIHETGQVKFTDAKPLSPDEAEKMLQQQASVEAEPDKVTFNFEIGECVRICEGAFENFEGEIKALEPDKGIVTVSLMVFGRPTPIDLESWKIEKASNNGSKL